MNHEEKRQTVTFQFTNMVQILPHGKLDSSGKYYEDNRLKKYYRNVMDQISFILLAVLCRSV